MSEKYLDDFEFEPNELSSDEFLSEVPLSLVKENIVAQFEDPLEHRKKDHVSTFLTMYRFSRDNVDAFEDEDKDNVMELRDSFYGFMITMFKEYLGIGFVDFELLDDEQQQNMIHFVYRFFLMNIKKNFVSFIINTIEENKSYYVEEYLEGDKERKKDVTTVSLKKEVSDPIDLAILTNLSDVIDKVLEEEIDMDDFFTKCDADLDCLETRFVKSCYDKDYITGNFIEPYIAMIDYDFKSDIESKIRNKILKKYRKK